DQGIPFPMSNGVTVIGGNEVLRVLSTVHINDPEGVRTAVVHNVNALEVGDFHKLCSVGRRKLSCPTRSFASCMGFELIDLSLVVNSLCPWLERNLIQHALRQGCNSAAPTTGCLSRN